MDRAVNPLTAAVGARARSSVPPASREAIAWDEIVRTVYAHMRSIVGPTSDLEDLTQAALEQVVRALPRFEGRSHVSTFTYRICVHIAMNHWRWYRRWLRRFRVGTDEAPEPACAREDEPGELTVEREQARRLYAALEKLAPKKRIVLTLSDFEGLSAASIGEIVGCPEATVRSRLRHARLELVAILQGDSFFTERQEGVR